MATPLARIRPSRRVSRSAGHRTWLSTTAGALLLVGALTLAPAVVAADTPASAAKPASVEQIEKGRAIVERLCTKCHATDVTGASPLPIAPPLRDLALKYPVEHLAEALAEGIMTGHREMPEFRFTPREVDVLLAYLDDLARRTRPR